MIIGLTIKNNDYSRLMTQFAKRIGNGDFIQENPPTTGPSEWHNWFRKTQTECCEAVKAENPTDKQKALLKYVIERSWRACVEQYNNADLADKMEITFPESIDTHWQNGEQYYIFPTSYEGHILRF